MSHLSKRKRIATLVAAGALIALLVFLSFFTHILPFPSPVIPKSSTLYLIFGTPNGQSSIHVINSTNGKELHIYLIPKNNQLLFFPEKNILYSINSGVLYASRIDGHPLWKHAFTEQNIVLNTVQYDAIYILSARTLYVLNTKDGTQRWQHTFAYDINIDAISITPKRIFVTSTPLLPSSSSIMAALDSQNGNVSWSFPPPHSNITQPNIIQPFTSDTLVFFSSSKGVYALQADNGTQLWYKEGLAYRSEPNAIVNGVAFFSYFLNPNEGGSNPQSQFNNLQSQDTTGFIRALKVSNHTEIWHYQCNENCDFGQMQVINGIVYVPTGPHLIALRATDGKVLWSHQCANLCDTTTFTPNGIYVYQDTTQQNLPIGVSTSNIPTPTSISGLVEKLDTSTGKVLWHVNFNTRPLQVYLAENGLLYIQEGFSKLYVLQTSNGQIFWHKDFKEAFDLLQVLTS